MVPLVCTRWGRWRQQQLQLLVAHGHNTLTQVHTLVLGILFRKCRNFFSSFLFSNFMDGLISAYAMQLCCVLVLRCFLCYPHCIAVFSLSNLTSHYVFSFVGEPTGVAVTMSDLPTQAFSFLLPLLTLTCY